MVRLANEKEANEKEGELKDKAGSSQSMTMNSIQKTKDLLGHSNVCNTRPVQPLCKYTLRPLQHASVVPLAYGIMIVVSH
jgi:hypothetical protein